MKKLLVLAATLLAVHCLYAQGNYLFDTNGHKVYFSVRNDIQYVKFVESLTMNEKNTLINSLSLLSNQIEEIGDNLYQFYIDSTNAPSFQSIVGGMAQVEYRSSRIVSLTDTSFKSWTKNKLFIEMNQNTEVEDMLNDAGIISTNVVQWDSHKPRYIVTLPRDANPITIANQLYETGDVFYAIPVFCIDNAFQTSYYSQQWGIENTGQDSGVPGVDINVVPVWPKYSGEGITVAIVDNGVELMHPDLYQNIDNRDGSTPEYDNGSNGGDPNNYHGTCCAGIVAAVDNNEGVKGVAYNARILSVKVGSGEILNTDEVVDGVNHAYNNGADVLNCSFGIRLADDGLPTIEMMPSIQALSNARTYGRDGKGCVVVCASGNDNDAFVHIPANQDGNLSVGAIDRFGIRSGGDSALNATETQERHDPWNSKYKGSCYGYNLKVVAPGTSCYTTTVNGEYRLFNGTSAACPHVSGVAALVLSANPGLNESEVRHIICSTTTKNRTDVYQYLNDDYHEHGTWNRFMGYGLVNANNAVVAAKKYDLYIRDNDNDDGTEPLGITYSSMTFNSPDIWMRRYQDGGTTNQGINFGDTNYVYVRIHNRGDVSSSPRDSVKLFTRSLGSNMNGWPTFWTNVGSIELPAIPAGGDAVVCFPVFIDLSNQYGWRHYPFLAQIVSKNDEQALPLSSNASINAYNYNNIAIENVSTARIISLDDETTTLAADTYVTNDEPTARLCNLRIKFPKNQMGGRLCDKAQVRLILSDELLQGNILNNMFSYHGVSKIDDTTFLVNDSIVYYNNVIISSNAVYRLRVHVNYLTGGGFEDEDYNINLLQTFLNEDEIGGSDIEITKEERLAFHANAGENILVERNSLVSLRAEGIGEPATYHWFNRNGNMVHSGQEFQITAETTTEYQLEVTASSDGFRDYDTVHITLLPSHITEIAPNPNSQNLLTVNYTLVDSSTARLLVANAYSSNETIGIIPINTGSSQCIIDISSYPQGVYSVSLMINGVIVDTKSFMRLR